MGLTLTADQAKQIDPKRVADDKLPKVFSAALQRDVPISRDFEAVLIMLPPATKQSAVGWLQQLQGYDPQQAGIRTVLAQFLDQEYSSLQARVSAALDGLGDLDQIKSGLLSTTLQGGQSVPEVSTLTADMSSLLGEHTAKSDAAVADLIANRIAYNSLVLGKQLDSTKKEASSYVVPLLSY